MRELEEVAFEIREIVVQYIRQKRLSGRSQYQIVAALDNLGDTSLALQSYEREGIGQTGPAKYLRLFGLLQSVYIQQDSLRFLYEKLIGHELPIQDDSAWFGIRELRNRIGGHPADRGGAVARITIKDTGFMMMHWEKGREKPEHEDVDLISLYRDYRSEAISAVRALRNKLSDPSYQPPWE